MDYKKIEVVSIILFITGVSFLFSGFQGVSGFVVGESLGVSFNLGVLIILIAVIIFVLVSRLQAIAPLDAQLFYDGFGESSSKRHGKVNVIELKKQRLLRNAREKFIEFYAKDPNHLELKQFIERLKKEGRLGEIV